MSNSISLLVSQQVQKISEKRDFIANPSESSVRNDTLEDPKDLEETVDVAAIESVLEKSDVAQALSNLNDYAQNIERQLNFYVDENTGRTVIQVVDSESEKVIREIPSEDILALARTMEDYPDDSKGRLIQIQV